MVKESSSMREDKKSTKDNGKMINGKVKESHSIKVKYSSKASSRRVCRAE